jgi:hypothetical protein
MKKTFIIPIVLLLATVLQAQISRNELSMVGNSRDLAGAIQPLSADQTFSYTIPDRFNFHKRETAPNRQPGGTFNSINTTVNRMAAKEERRNPATADFRFVMVTNGIENLSAPKLVPHRHTGTKAVEYTFKFPARLVVLNKEGDLLQTFILSADDKEYTTTVLPSFLDNVKQGEPLSDAGFRQRDTAILGWVSRNEAKIFERMEHNELIKLSKLAIEVIPAAYGFPRISARPLIYGLNRRDVGNFAELNNAVLKLQSEVETVFNKEPISQELIKNLMASGDFFASQYTSESSKEMIQVCATNAGVAYLLAGDIEKCIPHFVAAHKAFPVLRAGQATAIFEDINFIGQFRNAEKVMTVTPAHQLTNYIEGHGATVNRIHNTLDRVNRR